MAFDRVEWTHVVGAVGRACLPDSTPIREIGLDPLTSAALNMDGLPTLGSVRTYLREHDSLTTVKGIGEQRATAVRAKVAECDAVPGGFDPLEIAAEFNHASAIAHRATGGRVIGDSIERPGNIGPPALAFVVYEGQWVMRIRCPEQGGRAIISSRLTALDPRWHKYVRAEPFEELLLPEDEPDDESATYRESEDRQHIEEVVDEPPVVLGEPNPEPEPPGN